MVIRRLARILSGAGGKGSLSFKGEAYTLTCSTSRLNIWLQNGEFIVRIYLADGTTKEGSIRTEYILALSHEGVGEFIIIMDSNSLEITCDPPATLELLHQGYESAGWYENAESVVITWSFGRFKFSFSPPVQLS